MKQSKKIALCGITAAIGGMLLILYNYAPAGKLSLFALSSVAVMVPVSKKLYGGAMLSLIASALIGFAAGGLAVFLPYILFFGPHPILNIYLDRLKIKGYTGYAAKVAAKLVYINLVMYILYNMAIFAGLFAFNVQYYIIAIIVSLIFIPYDYLMGLVQKRIDYLSDRYIKS